MSDGKLTKETAADFIELTVDQAPMFAAMHVRRFRWPFPWKKPTRWPAWVVWRIARWRSKERFDVELPRMEQG
jgi:hypothetical protein